MHKHKFNYLEEITRSYYDTLKQIEEIEYEIVHGTPVQDDIHAGKVSVRNISDDTANRAIALTIDKRLCRLKELADAIKKTYDELIDEKQELIKLYYWSNARKNLTGIADDINITPRTAYRWRNEFIYKLAKRLGEN